MVTYDSTTVTGLTRTCAVTDNYRFGIAAVIQRALIFATDTNLLRVRPDSSSFLLTVFKVSCATSGEGRYRNDFS